MTIERQLVPVAASLELLLARPALISTADTFRSVKVSL